MQTFFFAVFSAAYGAVTEVRALLLFPSLLLMWSITAAAESSTGFISDGDLLAEDLQRVEDSRPVVYLTFDDGPSADTVTEDLLTVLARHNATATFFVTGHRVRKAQDKIAEIVYAGHAIGNHTVSHARLTEVSDKKALSELKSASEIILSAGGPPATCFRPPFGSTNSRINGLASRLGLVPVGWSVDTRDWERTTSVSEITEVLNRVKDKSIVLLHDGPSHRGKMLNAFSDWMDAEAHRFQFRALPQCSASSIVQLAGTEVPDVVPVAATVSSKKPVVSPLASAEKTAAEPPVVVLPPVERVYATIPELLAKIRAYRFELHDDRRRVNLSQVTATLDAEIQGNHTFYSF